MNLAYPYTVTAQASGGYLVKFVDFEEAITEGDTLEEAAFNAAEVLSGIMAYRLEHNQSVPEPSAGEFLARPTW